MARDVIDAVLGQDGGRSATEPDRRPAARRGRRPRRARRGSPPSSRRSRRSPRSARRPRRGWSPGTGPRRRPWSASARSSDLLRPLVPGRPFLEAEVTWAARHELALSLDDVLARRTRLAQELPDRGAAIAPRVAELLGAELGWGETRQAREVEAYLELGPARVLGGRRRRGDEPRSTDGTRQVGSRHRDVIVRHAWSHRCRSSMDLDDLARAFFDALYDYRIPVAIGVGDRGRHPGRRRLAARLVRGGPPAPGRTGVARRARPGRRPAARPGISPRRSSSGPRSSSRRRSAPSSSPTRRGRTAVAPRRRRRPAPTGRRRRSAPSATPTPDAVRTDHASPAGRSTARTTSTSGAGRPPIIEMAPGPLPPSARGLLGPQRAGPVRLPVAGGRGYADGALELGKLKATDGVVRLRPAGRHRSGRLRERDHLVQAVQPPVRDGAVRIRPDSRIETDESRGYASVRATAYHPARKCRGSVRGQNVARRTRTPLTADARNPTGSRRLPRGVSFSCTATRT